MAQEGQAAAGWREVEAYLRDAINRHEFEVGGQIPTEAELMERFGASRYAVRRAMTRLQDNGLVRIEQGRGTFVHDGYLVSYKIAQRSRFTSLLIENHIAPGQEILHIRRVPVPEGTLQHLQLSEGSHALYMELLGYADGLVVKHDTHYFPLPRFEGLEMHLRRASSVTEALTRFGIADVHRKETSIIGRLPTPVEARMLRQLPGQPILECQRLDTDETGRPIIFGITLFNCELVRLVV